MAKDLRRGEQDSKFLFIRFEYTGTSQVKEMKMHAMAKRMKSGSATIKCNASGPSTAAMSQAPKLVVESGFQSCSSANRSRTGTFAMGISSSPTYTTKQ